MTPSSKQEQQARRMARLAAALRENLKRRKAQARGRREGEANEAAASGNEHNGQGPDFRRNRSSE
jgi:hypothetical protein